MIKKLFVLTFFTIFLKSYGFDDGLLTFDKNSFSACSQSLSTKKTGISFSQNPDIQSKLLTPSYKKALFFYAHAKTVQKSKKSFVTINAVKNSLGNIIKYDKVEDFIGEEDSITHSKKRFIIEANKNDYIIPISHFDAMLITYKNSKIPVFNQYARIPIKHYLNTTYNAFLPLLNTLKTKESNTFRQGKHTFYHTIRRDIYISMYIHTKIVEITNKTSFPDFLMLRMPNTRYNPTEDGAVLREEFLKNGGQQNDYMPKEQYHLLSVNHTILSNMKSIYESSAQLLYANKNASPFVFRIEPLFDYYSLANIYAEFRDDLEKLSIGADSGVLLELIANDVIIKKASYASAPYGKKLNDAPYKPTAIENKELITKSPGLLSRKNCTDSLKRQNYCRRPPLDRLQWRLILTDDLLLSPSNPETREEFKVKAYALDQQALDEFHQKVDALFEKIKLHYEEQNKVPHRV